MRLDVDVDVFEGALVIDFLLVDRRNRNAGARASTRGDKMERRKSECFLFSLFEKDKLVGVGFCELGRYIC